MYAHDYACRSAHADFYDTDLWQPEMLLDEEIDKPKSDFDLFLDARNEYIDKLRKTNLKTL